MKFSIIIPAKNEELNINFCLEALGNQNLLNGEYEVIVVDNGSSDATVSIVKKYGFSVYIKPDISLSGLRNFGASVASGGILVFLDADCIPDVNWLNNAAIALDDTEVGCTGSTPVAPEYGPWVEQVWSSFRTRRKGRCFVSWINSSNFIVRREHFRSVGGFNTKVKTCEDVDICMRLNKICKIVFDPSIKVIHLGEPKTLTQFFIKEVWRGKGSISGIISHGISLSEIKSLLLPIYYLIITIGIIISILTMNYYSLMLLIMAYVFPAMIFMLLVVSKTRKYTYAIGYFILFIVYANARSVAVFSK